MATMVVSSIFIDTNILVYASIAEAPLHTEALRVLQEVQEAGRQVFISRQVLREYLATLTRPQLSSGPLPAIVLTAQVRQFQQRFQIAEDSTAVTQRLMDLIEQIPMGGKQVHDANIVATMLVHGIDELLTHNTADFNRFANLITLTPLLPGS